MNLLRNLVWALLLGIAVAAVGCDDSPVKSCNEECEHDDECIHNHRCLMVTSPEAKQICLPSECATCFSQGRWGATCTTEVHGSDPDHLTCTFTRCGTY